MKLLALFLSTILSLGIARADDGYRLWLRYDRIDDPRLLQEYRAAIPGVWVNSESPTLHVAAKELQLGLEGLLDRPAEAEQPNHTLPYYENLQLYYAPGTANSGVPQKTNP